MYLKVDYVDHFGSDLSVANAARVSFHKRSEFNEDGSLKDKDKRLIKYLARENHIAPFQHPQLTLKEKVPIFVARQRFKHSVGFTYSEVSRRYVDEAPEFFVPDEWRARPEGSMKQGSGDTHKLSNSVAASYASLINRVEELYNEMILIGVAPEQARMILPQSMYTEYIVTGSLAAFARAYKLRIDSHSQKEIQYLAVEWDKIIRPLYPESWSALVDE